MNNLNTNLIVAIRLSLLNYGEGVVDVEILGELVCRARGCRISSHIRPPLPSSQIAAIGIFPCLFEVLERVECVQPP